MKLSEAQNLAIATEIANKSELLLPQRTNR
jgi:hypothetical protein